MPPELRTFLQKPRVFQHGLHRCVKRQLGRRQRWAMAGQEPVAPDGVQVVGQCYAVAAGDFEYLVLAVAVEGSPLNIGLASRGFFASPVEDGFFALVPNRKLTAYVGGREADDESAKLRPRSRCIDVGFKLARRPRVDLGSRDMKHEPSLLVN